ncbi:toxin-antitoxin system HicB family antitoxin [Jidongwangia harbinensis]|uniref:toxin-antitoxin system HicB family antitoxin n=1 Tax=Jidongwangia harbinensis TaxID=2878561 RepID=UPI001CD98834|nr:toxin-antitoxin system HicB family antitoxin [Jidongwangia harbinensis]MCA2219148.1 toxin-antitoxin system HicB family antitoxin [Jidongwangia harbinensis]
MDLTPYLETLRADLAAAAAPGGPETGRAAELLAHSLEASARLVMLEVLSDAAAEITTRLSDAAVEVRLRGREADLVVSHAAEPPPEPPVPDGGDLTRLTLRMPESLKTHVEQTAAAEGISVNAWLVRAVTAAVQRPAGPPAHGGRTGRRITGFAQA